MDFPERDNQIAVSPDGSMIAYVAAAAGEAPRLFLRRLDAASEQIVGDAIDVRDPFFSPDGRWVGFFAGDTIRKVSIADGQSRVMCHAPGVRRHRGPRVHPFRREGRSAHGGHQARCRDGGPVEMISRPDGDAASAPAIATTAARWPDDDVHGPCMEAAGAVHRIVVHSQASPPECCSMMRAPPDTSGTGCSSISETARSTPPASISRL